MRSENKMDGCRLVLSIFAVFVAFSGALDGKIIHVKHAPSYIVFQEGADNTLASSNLPSQLSAALGVKSQKYAGAIKTKSVFKRPAANFLLTFVTSKGHEIPMESLASFPLDWDTPFVDVEQIMNNVQRKFLSEDPLMLNLMSGDQLFNLETRNPVFQSIPSSLTFAKERLLDSDSIVSQHPSVHFNSSHEADGKLLAELQTVQDVVSTLKSNPDTVKTKTPDLLSFTLTGLKAVGDAHGIGSQEVGEAEKLVAETVDKLTDDLKTIYGGNVLVEVIITPALDHGNVRHTRSLMAAPKNNFTHLNLALDWYDDFPVSFNIVLFLMLVLIIVIIFIAYGIWNMNPNLDSILYRVPQDDLKKTN